MDALHIENIRCFAGPHRIPLAPLTILVGENSTGKTTLLACARLAYRLLQSLETPDFNEEPFHMGAFQQIATYRGGRGGRAQEFSLGLETQISAGQTWRLLNRFQDLRSQPALVSQHFFADERQLYEFRPRDPNEIEKSQLRPETVNRMRMTVSLRGNLDIDQVYASAPIRSEPRRTYEPGRYLTVPSGGHVPMILAQIYGSKEWAKLQKPLEDFGKASGLFKKLEVKRLGRHESSPFQVRIKVQGPAFNLIDVGYGVSQALPLAVDLLQAKPKTLFLLQQPEVHLHPRAQAALGTLLGALVASGKKRFLIETHSDHLLDRVRMDVRDGKNLKPEQVRILYFERTGVEMKVHPLSIDAQGNLLDAPASYRSFFLEEERRFLVG